MLCFVSVRSTTGVEQGSVVWRSFGTFAFGANEQHNMSAAEQFNVDVRLEMRGSRLDAW